MKTFALVFWLCCPLASAVAAPSVLLRSDVSPKEIYIGDTIRYRITVAFSTPVTAQPLKVEKILSEFELLDLNSTPPQMEKEGKTSITHTLLMTSFSTGSLTIPPLSLSFSLPEGTLSTAQTEAIPIKVKSLLEEKGDEGHLRPVKGFFNFRSYFWLWIALGVLAGILLIYLLFKYIRRKQGKDGHPEAPPRPADEIALEALKTLEAEDLIGQKQYKEFYFRLSTICREYLENRFGMSAVEKTTAELLQEFRRLNWSLSQSQPLRELFDNADLVKFAKFDPPLKDIPMDVERARKFIDITTPKSVPSSEKDEIPV